MNNELPLFTEGARVPFTPREMSDDGLAIRLARMHERGVLIPAMTGSAYVRIERGLGLLATSRKEPESSNV